MAEQKKILLEWFAASYIWRFKMQTQVEWDRKMAWKILNETAQSGKCKHSVY